MHMRPFLIGLLLCTITASAAHADSDGYYCVGADYLAVEFRSFSTPGIAGKHVLRIARWGGIRGPEWAGEVVMDDFQPHIMTCGQDEIVIEGAGDRPNGWLTYTIRLDSVRRPEIAARTNELQYDFTTKRSQNLPNLGNWSQPGVTRLSDPAASAVVQIRMTRTSQPMNPGMRHDRKSVLEELDAEGNVHCSLLLFEGMSEESGGVFVERDRGPADALAQRQGRRTPVGGSGDRVR